MCVILFHCVSVCVIVCNLVSVLVDVSVIEKQRIIEQKLNIERNDSKIFMKDFS